METVKRYHFIGCIKHSRHEIPFTFLNSWKNGIGNGIREHFQNVDIEETV